MTIAVKALTIWFGILLLAVANGALREVIFLPRLGKTVALPLSGLLLVLLILLVTFCTFPWLQLDTLSQAMTVGLGWLALTLIFEFSFGRYQGKSWSTLLAAYTFKDGNLWPVVLLVIAFAPYTVGRLQGLV